MYKIASFTPPAGIIRSFNAEKTCFSLERGDTVLMLSDGIVQNSDDAPWLCEMLSFEKSETPSSITEKVLAKACRINARDDDMTCVAVKVF
jgi:serine phosphatase RsbU (regulator of sigma subunit)